MMKSIGFMIFLITANLSSSQPFWEAGNIPWMKGRNVWPIAANSQGHIFCAIGDEGLLRTTDEGMTWHNFSGQIPEWKTAVLFLNDTDVFCAGDGGVFRSTDGGETWISLHAPAVYSPLTGTVFCTLRMLAAGRCFDRQTSEIVGNRVLELKLERDLRYPCFSADTKRIRVR